MVLGEKKRGFFGKLRQRVSDAIMRRPTVDETTLEELEEVLITSDIGMETSVRIIERLREDVRTQRISEPAEVEAQIARIVASLVDKGERMRMAGTYPLIVLMIGVNGGGKTTTIAKLARMYKAQGHSVLLAAADTFRAAAADQLAVWGERIGADVVRGPEGGDPSSVIFDAIRSAKARDIDVLICDTAGRLQNKRNLMSELEKMGKVIGREYPEAVRENLLVLDATTGKNAVSQAKEFGLVADVTGIVVTKLDGTAKGGVAVTVSDEFDLPIKFIGVGEKPEDLEPFDPVSFAESIVEDGGKPFENDENDEGDLP